MKFLRIELLFLIWVVPLLALVFWYGHRKRRNLLAGFADTPALRRLVPTETPARRRLQAFLVLAAMVFLVLAVAGPQYGFQWQKIERQGVDIVIALDCSRSMLSTDIQPTRLDRAKREIIDLLHMLEGDRVALTAFSGTAFLQCPLTLDYQAFDLFLNVLTPDYLPVGGTDLSAAVKTSVAAFDPMSKADKAIILITDGENTGAEDPMDAARDAAKAGVKLFCIGVGAEQGVPVPAKEGGFKKDSNGQIVLSRLDETLLSRMALATGGAYVRSVAGDMDLDAIYRDRIHRNLKSATLESGRRQVWADRYQWPLALAVAALFIGLWLPMTRKPVAMILLAAVLLLPGAVAHAGPLQEGYRAYEKGDYEKALKSFVQGQLNDPDRPDVLYNLGNAYYQNKSYDAAREHYAQALKQLKAADGKADGKNDAARKSLEADIHYNLGNASYRKGELEKAVKDYEAALDLKPDDEQAKENLAFVKKQLQQQQEKQQRQQQQQGDKQGDQKNSATDQQSGKGRQDQKDKASSPPSNAQDQQAGSSADQNRQTAQDRDTGQKPPPDKGGHATDDKHMADQNRLDQDKQSDQTSASAAGEGQPEGEKKPDAALADQMLNRLKDEPGRAMMPHYQKRQVEKDW